MDVNVVVNISFPYADNLEPHYAYTNTTWATASSAVQLGIKTCYPICVSTPYLMIAMGLGLVGKHGWAPGFSVYWQVPAWRLS